MGQVLVKVRDFAQRCGCTPQNIYGHLKTYAADLEGHTFQGKGRQGVLLDEYAQDFLKSIMYPKDLTENVLVVQVNELRGQLMQAETEKLRLGSVLVETQAALDRALIDVRQHQKLLDASQEAHQEEMKQATEALEQMRAEAAQRLQEAEMATERELSAQRKLHALEKYAADLQQYYIDLERYKKRWIKWGVEKPAPPKTPIEEV